MSSAPFTLYVCVCTNAGLGSSLSKHAFDIQEMVAHVSNRDMVLFLLILTGKVTAYFILLDFTAKILYVYDSHSESKDESRILSELSESQCSLPSLGF